MILTILSLQPTSGYAIVRKIDENTVVMTSADFRALMTDLAVRDAENAALKDTLKKERLTVDGYMTEIETLRKNFADERAAMQDERSAIKKARKYDWLWYIAAIGTGYAIGR